jgi:hypothetical protein
MRPGHTGEAAPAKSQVSSAFPDSQPGPSRKKADQSLLIYFPFSNARNLIHLKNTDFLVIFLFY